MLAEATQKRVVIIDTSNEIAGDGDVPHPGIASARRMQVLQVCLVFCSFIIKSESCSHKLGCAVPCIWVMALHNPNAICTVTCSAGSIN